MHALDILLDGPGPQTAKEFRILAKHQRETAARCASHGFPDAAESLRTLAHNNEVRADALERAVEGSVETIAA